MEGKEKRDVGKPLGNSTERQEDLGKTGQILPTVAGKEDKRAFLHVE